MQQTNQILRPVFWTSWVMSGIVILFMLMDAVGKFVQPAEVVQGTIQLGFAEHHILIIGILGFISTLFYVIPRTSVLGAILLTGFWGGAVATNFRLDLPLFSHILFPAYLGILAWGGLILRNPLVKNIFTLTNY